MLLIFLSDSGWAESQNLKTSGTTCRVDGCEIRSHSKFVNIVKSDDFFEVFDWKSVKYREELHKNGFNLKIRKPATKLHKKTINRTFRSGWNFNANLLERRSHFRGREFAEYHFELNMGKTLEETSDESYGESKNPIMQSFIVLSRSCNHTALIFVKFCGRLQWSCK